MAINSADFGYISQLVYDRSAIMLEAGKEYLVESRLGPLMENERLDSFRALVGQLRTQPYNGLHQKVVEAMTTNETSFFRDLHPFEALKKPILPELIEKRAGTRSLTIWCAACSSGHEPYTILILLQEQFPELANWSVRLIASDISHEMLARTKAGRFSQLEINRGLPAPLLVKYFHKQGLEWQVKESLRQRLELCHMNLASTWPTLPPADIVFLRNVLIYFNTETKRTILGKIRKVLRPDGYMFLGSAETTINLDDGFERMQLDRAGCYRLRAR